ncbi:MAG: hypothetical protein Q9160_002126 [Pyrenula sp. 1 TL-2023]
MVSGKSSKVALFTIAIQLFVSSVAAQTFTKCNPLTQGGCDPDPALGKSVNVDFSSAPDSFTPSGNINYGSDGAAFTVAQHGDSPQITSKWYIMFGHVEFVIKAAPGTGIVSSAVLQSDCLDEIDLEWIGGDDGQVQSNYFGKGQTTTYNRGAFHAVSGNHDQFHTYTIDWTAEQIVWQVDGKTVRALTQENAASGQYPQTPMQIKLGAWAGGDSSNPQGTIQWAGGTVDYSAGPYTMYVKSIKVQDYSTGSQYTYSGSAGTWQSIQSSGGKINSGGSGSVSSDSSAPAVSASSNPPSGFGGNYGGSTSSSASVPNVYPWVPDPTATLVTSTSTATTYPGLPSGWTVSDTGKVIPPSAAPVSEPPPKPLLVKAYASTEYSLTSFQSTSQSPLPSQPSSPSSVCVGALETVTTYDSKGFLTTAMVAAGAAKTFNDQGFLITATGNPAGCQATGSIGGDSQAAQADGISSSTTPLVFAHTFTHNVAQPTRIAPALAALGILGGVLMV